MRKINKRKSQSRKKIIRKHNPDNLENTIEKVADLTRNSWMSLYKAFEILDKEAKQKTKDFDIFNKLANDAWKTYNQILNFDGKLFYILEDIYNEKE